MVCSAKVLVYLALAALWEDILALHLCVTRHDLPVLQSPVTQRGLSPLHAVSRCLCI